MSRSSGIPCSSDPLKQFGFKHSYPACSAIHALSFKTITQNKGLGLEGSIAVKRNVELDTSSLVDCMLAQKIESINAATKEIKECKNAEKKLRVGNIESSASQRRFTFSLWQMPFKGRAYQTQF